MPRERDVTEQDRSVVSGMTVADLKRLPAPAPLPAARLAPTGRAETMPTKLSPMLAETGEAPFTHPDWLFEPKLDGYRVLAFVRDGEVTLRSRRGLDLTPAFPADRRRTRPAVRRHDPRRRGAGARRGRAAVVQRAAESRAAEDAARDRRRRARHAGGSLLLRPAALRRPRPASGAVLRPPPLPRAVPAAIAPRAASFTRPTTALPSMRRRWPRASRASWPSAATAATKPAAARPPG